MKPQLHVMLLAQTLGSGHTAPLVEMAACVFDPDTGEITPEYRFAATTDIRKEIRQGKPTPKSLANFMLARKYDFTVFDNPQQHADAAEGVLDLFDWFNAVRSRAGADLTNTRVYCLMPHAVLPRIEWLHHEVNGNEDPIWPSYGVVCAKTLQDIARPLMVKHNVDLPHRSPSHKGLGDECNWQATATMHAIQLLQGNHAVLVGKPSKPAKAKAAHTYSEDDDEL